MQVNLRETMGPLAQSNELLGDAAALAEQWDRNGYWFFRGVLSRDTVEEMRATYLRTLKEMGVVERGDSDLWNGSDLTSFPFKIPALEQSSAWRDMVRTDDVNALLTRLLGDEPYWVPLVEHRMTPPRPDFTGDPFLSRHQDAFYNREIPFWTCWFPLTDIDADVGGIALAEGWHKRGILHDLEAAPNYQIPADCIPDSAWRRSDYRLGDILIFDNMLPHSGLCNTSDRFRLSVDLRVMGASEELPVIGALVAVEEDSVTIEEASGGRVRLLVDDDTFIRLGPTDWLRLEDLRPHATAGLHVIAAQTAGRATAIRPARY